MEKYVILVYFLLSSWCFLKAQNAACEKSKKEFKKYTYIIEVSAKRKDGLDQIFAMAVKVKHQNFLLTCLHAFYQVGLPDTGFTNYYLRSVTGIERKIDALRPESNLYYAYDETLEGNHSAPKCKVAKIDINRDLAFIEIPPSMGLSTDSGVEFLDISNEESFNKYRDSLNERELSVIAPNFTDYSFECIGVSADLDNIGLSSCMTEDMIEENRTIGIPDMDTAKAIKIHNGSIRHGASGGPVFNMQTNRLLGILWGGNTDYENVAIIPNFADFVDTVTSEDSSKLKQAFWSTRSGSQTARKSRVGFAEGKSVEGIRWYFPYGILTKNMMTDILPSEIKSSDAIIRASIIYANDYLSKYQMKLRPSMGELRLNAFCEKYYPDKLHIAKGREDERIAAFNRSHPVTAAFINLNGLFYRFYIKPQKYFTPTECDSVTKAFELLKELVDNRHNIKPDELKIWDFFGFSVLNYLERISNIIAAKCPPPVPPEDNCQIALIKLNKLKQNNPTADELRNGYINVCEKCDNLAYCDSAADIASTLSCENLKRECLKRASSAWNSFYLKYGLDFIMPSGTMESAREEKLSEGSLLVFPIGISKTSTAQTTMIDNYNISQRGLDDHNKIFDVLNDYIYEMTKILAPILDGSYQRFVITGQADGIPYNKKFKPEPLLGDIDNEWVYRLNDDASLHDSIQFKELVKSTSKPDDKNYALAFQRAMQFKQKLPNADLTFTIPYHKDVRAAISHVQGPAFRNVEIQMIFKLKDCN